MLSNEVREARLKCQLVTTPEPNARNSRLVVRAEENHAAEGVLAHLVQSLEHTCREAPPSNQSPTHPNTPPMRLALMKVSVSSSEYL